MISLEQARTVISAARAHGQEHGLKPLTVVVLDAGGHLITMEREDGSGYGRPQIAQGKAAGALAMGKAVLFVALMMVVGRYVVPALLGGVVSTRSRELFVLVALTIAAGTALASAAFFGVSLALGAFVAGVACPGLVVAGSAGAASAASAAWSRKQVRQSATATVAHPEGTRNQHPLAE